MKEKKENIYLWSVIILAVLSALPLLWLSFYNHPSADDYMYAAETYRVWNETHSIWQVIKAAVQTSAEFYENWQGLYVSAFVLALQPAVFGEQFYALTGFFMFAILYGGNLFFCHQVFYRQLGCRRLESTAYGCMLSFVMVQWMPSVVQGLYWFNGAMNYVLFFALLEVFFCLLLTIEKDCVPRKKHRRHDGGACCRYFACRGKSHHRIYGDLWQQCFLWRRCLEKDGMPCCAALCRSSVFWLDFCLMSVRREQRSGRVILRIRPASWRRSGMR